MRPPGRSRRSSENALHYSELGWFWWKLTALTAPVQPSDQRFTDESQMDAAAAAMKSAGTICLVWSRFLLVSHTASLTASLTASSSLGHPRTPGEGGGTWSSSSRAAEESLDHRLHEAGRRRWGQASPPVPPFPPSPGEPGCCSRQKLRGSPAPSGNAGVASWKAEIPKPARNRREAEVGGASGLPGAPITQESVCRWGRG